MAFYPRIALTVAALGIGALVASTWQTRSDLYAKGAQRFEVLNEQVYLAVDPAVAETAGEIEQWCRAEIADNPGWLRVQAKNPKMHLDDMLTGHAYWPGAGGEFRSVQNAFGFGTNESYSEAQIVAVDPYGEHRALPITEHVDLARVRVTVEWTFTGLLPPDGGSLSVTVEAFEGSRSGVLADRWVAALAGEGIEAALVAK